MSAHNHSHCIEQAMQRAETICQEQSLRFTPVRQDVLKLVWASHKPVKAYDLLDQLSSTAHSAKPPTVYRALDFLLEHGLVHKLDSLNAYVGCSHPLSHNHCYFLICRECGDASECCNDNITRAIDTVTGSQGFRPQRVTVEIEGTCKGCSKGTA